MVEATDRKETIQTLDRVAIVPPVPENGKPMLIDPDLGFIEELGRLGGESFKKCYQCATCSAACPVSPDLAPFPRKEMVWAIWGIKDRLVKDPDIWLCHQCNDCSTMCPRGGNPGDILAVARNYCLQHYSFPPMLGKMVASPKYLPVLLAIPVILILALKAMFGHGGGSEEAIVFEHFFPHYVLDPFFILTSLWAILAVGIGLTRFWGDMKGGSAPPATGERLGLVPSFLAALKEVFTHEKFRKCDAASPRNLSHLLVFYGFLALFVTTTLVFFGLYTPRVLGLVGIDFPELTPLPMPLLHPVKILGNVGALLFAAGLGLMVYHRATDKSKAGVTNYYDVLFLGVMCGLAITGILTQLIRLAGLATLAYSMYFIHLVLIFCLIAYLPYSKFAHIAYRMVAIAYAKHTKRM